jgi:DNA-binding MarR family transcriptional regulator
MREDLLMQVFESFHAFKRALQDQLPTLVGKFPISGAQLELLSTVHHMQPASHKQLAIRLHLSAGAVSQLVDGLFELGLVNREISPHDRRLQLLRLSKKGDKALQEINNNRRLVMHRLMEDLTTEELEFMLRIQKKIIGQLTNLPTDK